MFIKCWNWLFGPWSRCLPWSPSLQCQGRGAPWPMPRETCKKMCKMRQKGVEWQDWLGMADSVDNGVDAGCSLGQEGGQLSCHRSQDVSTTVLTDHGQSCVWRPSNDPQRHISDGHFGNPNLSAFGIFILITWPMLTMRVILLYRINQLPHWTGDFQHSSSWPEPSRPSRDRWQLPQSEEWEKKVDDEYDIIDSLEPESRRIRQRPRVDRNSQWRKRL